MRFPEFMVETLSQENDSAVQVAIRVSEICDVLKGYHESGLPIAKHYCAILGLCGEKIIKETTLRVLLGLREMLKGVLADKDASPSSKRLKGDDGLLKIEEWNKARFYVKDLIAKAAGSQFLKGKVLEEFEMAFFVRVGEKTKVSFQALNKGVHRSMSETFPLFLVISGKIKKDDFADIIDFLLKKFEEMDPDQTGQVDFDKTSQWLHSELNFNPKDLVFFNDYFSQFLVDGNQLQYHRFISHSIAKAYPEYWKQMQATTAELFEILRIACQMASLRVREEKSHAVLEVVSTGDYKRVKELAIALVNEGADGMQTPKIFGHLKDFEFLHEFKMVIESFSPMSKILIAKSASKDFNPFRVLPGASRRKFLDFFYNLIETKFDFEVFLAISVNQQVNIKLGATPVHRTNNPKRLGQRNSLVVSMGSQNFGAKKFQPRMSLLKKPKNFDLDVETP